MAASLQLEPVGEAQQWRKAQAESSYASARVPVAAPVLRGHVLPPALASGQAAFGAPPAAAGESAVNLVFAKGAAPSLPPPARAVGYQKGRLDDAAWAATAVGSRGAVFGAPASSSLGGSGPPLTAAAAFAPPPPLHPPSAGAARAAAAAAARAAPPPGVAALLSSGVPFGVPCARDGQTAAALLRPVATSPPSPVRGRITLFPSYPFSSPLFSSIPSHITSHFSFPPPLSPQTGTPMSGCSQPTSPASPPAAARRSPPRRAPAAALFGDAHAARTSDCSQRMAAAGVTSSAAAGARAGGGMGINGWCDVPIASLLAPTPETAFAHAPPMGGDEMRSFFSSLALRFGDGLRSFDSIFAAAARIDNLGGNAAKLATVHRLRREAGL